MWKKISCLLAIMVLLFAGKTEVSAEINTMGSITIKLAETEDKTPKDNVKMAVTKVADLENGELIILDEYKDLGINFNDIQTTEDLSLASEKLSEAVKDGTVILTDKDGKAELKNLEAGAYLVYAKDSSKYGDIIPAVVQIPTWSETEGTMIYDIVVTPKYTPLLTAVQVNKVDSVTKKAVLSKDFVFGIYSDKECEKLISKENADKKTGTATFNDLRYGTYYIKELEAPKGYKLSDEVKKVVINNDLEGVGDVHSFVYENTLLPASTVQTGDTSTILPYVGVLIICIVGIGIVTARKKKS